LGIGNIEQTKKLHGVLAWLLGGRVRKGLMIDLRRALGIISLDLAVRIINNLRWVHL
jgi:hypothetical protein